ncbi:DUF4919 domain-containing protein [Chryseobacterium sp.]|uniref:DUF4919 domain-containing protein n=1 Tax=Chryseobacterium sp. TaxID=1871047 RepID=UPI00289EFE9C|nr:DUF4919 domain-containing protein [Chryseobacterium sp.]
MKKILIIPFLLILSFFSAQNGIDFKEISTNVKDSTGRYFYEKLVYKFGHLPDTLDSLEIKNLYFGKDYASGADSKKIVVVGDFLKLARAKKYKDAITEGEKILKEDPVNLEVLGTLVQMYDKSDKENRLFPLRAIQFRTLLQGIILNYQIKNDQKIYTVTSVTDEYIVASILEYNLYSMRRKSEHVSDGIIDHWKQGKNKISFLVHYKVD